MAGAVASSVLFALWGAYKHGRHRDISSSLATVFTSAGLKGITLSLQLRKYFIIAS